MSISCEIFPIITLAWLMSFMNEIIGDKVKNSWNCTSAAKYAYMAWCLVKAQGQLHLYHNVDSNMVVLLLINSFATNKY